MKKIIFLFVGIFTLMSFTNIKSTDPYKCLIQMKNYSGEGAYIVISLLDENDEYLKTIQVRGEDDEWYHDISEWWNFQGKNKASLDGITGATISGGSRAVTSLEINPDWIGKNYSLRFETAVEDKAYHLDDIKIKLTQELLKGQTLKGSGFIRFVKILAQ
ncbi:MAG: DUF2271 domain-containing protein [Psychroflexus halocasei]